MRDGRGSRAHKSSPRPVARLSQDHERTARYQALERLANRWATHPTIGGRSGERKDLTSSEFRVFSQNGEDGVIEEIVRRIGAPERTFVEFGTESGVEGNCIFLAEVLGWSGLFIEADEANARRLCGRYEGRASIRTIHAFVTPDNINSIITGAGFAGDVSILSIDIDGHDFWVWKAITAVRPKIVIIEYNSSVPTHECLVQPLSDTSPWTGSDAFGASLGALERLGGSLGYRLVHTDLTGVNAFFVRSDLTGDLPDADDVPRRRANYFFTGQGHPKDVAGREMTNPFDD